MAVALALFGLCLGACGFGTSGLSFVEDERVDILRPADHSVVSVPFKVQWSAEDFRTGADAGSFAVFLDRAPQPPGETIAWMFRDDGACTAAPSCPDSQYLADHHVFLTDQRMIEITDVPHDTGDDQRRLHEVTVVLLDEQGRRIGESAWTVSFKVRG